jgi:gamma-glutamyl-gamma-aminobutyrate hydrolase PuuD
MNLDKNEFDKLTGDKVFDNCLFLGGGTDVHSGLYDEDPHPQTGMPDTARDHSCMKKVIKAIGQRKPVIGICRGSQFLGVFNGNKLHQHCEGETHGQVHIIGRDRNLNFPNILERDLGDYIDGFLGQVTHHQTLRVTKPWSCRILAKSAGGQVGIKPDGTNYVIPIVPQVVYYPQFNHLGIQFHAEWMEEMSPARIWLREVIYNCLGIQNAC